MEVEVETASTKAVEKVRGGGGREGASHHFHRPAHHFLKQKFFSHVKSENIKFS